MYRYGIIGFGGLGKKHLCNLYEIEKMRGDFKLAAICGTTLEEAKKGVKINLGSVNVSSVDFSSCNFYQDYKEMLDNENLDFILSVLPTFLHEEVALYALKSGVHLFSEKPMALTLEGCKKMIEASKQNNAKLMIGHCLRFHSGFRIIKEFIDTKKYGNVRYASFERYSQTPLWTFNNWILDVDKSGGSVIDFHIHDVDLINWYFGKPNSINSVIKNSKIPLEGVQTQYFYDNFMVTATAEWSLPQTFPFAARCRIDFDDASVVIENDKLSVYCDDSSYSEDYDLDMAFKYEIEAFIKLVIDNEPCNLTSPEEIYESMKIAISEIDFGKSI